MHRMSHLQLDQDVDKINEDGNEYQDQNDYSQTHAMINEQENRDRQLQMMQRVSQ